MVIKAVAMIVTRVSIGEIGLSLSLERDQLIFQRMREHFRPPSDAAYC